MEPEWSATAVLIPALNEEQALPSVLEALPLGRLHSVVVADNGSTDGTGEAARRLGARVVREERKGYGSACLAGIRHLAALPEPPDVLVFMDADHPEDAERLPELLLSLQSGADLVLGARLQEGGETGNVHIHARWGNRFILGAVRLLWGRQFQDLAPFRAIRFSQLLALDMDDEDWGWTLQMQIRAIQAGLTIVELLVPHRPRSVGRSKISGSLNASVRVGAKMFYTLARERLRGGFRR
ncbi:MAG: glycosyltransferase family 2 protein [Gemmatimonadetes bacterium]|nr:glycosyltransferase family 2 protein [Gemmatimonadota bacterium]